MKKTPKWGKSGAEFGDNISRLLVVCDSESGTKEVLLIT